ncbi:hypothetical protein E2C01_091504 [Portunus trituberculatus]|uniref:Uncharacterized protein n=1 Tax=Portunus trituberculatus TaxID=210409 RepID=A0A5B7JPK0_PORTR|nr:hypothetical protein [Portunus trituberculatus]
MEGQGGLAPQMGSADGVTSPLAALPRFLLTDSWRRTERHFQLRCVMPLCSLTSDRALSTPVVLWGCAEWLGLLTPLKGHAVGMGRTGRDRISKMLLP